MRAASGNFSCCEIDYCPVCDILRKVSFTINASRRGEGLMNDPGTSRRSFTVRTIIGIFVFVGAVIAVPLGSRANMN